MDLERKSIPFQLAELKARDDGGWEVSGYASTFGGEPDSYGDVVVKGAFLHSLTKRMPLLFYQHGEPIGAATHVIEDAKGLFGRFSIVDTATGTDAYKLAKAGILTKLSIGYRTVAQDFREDGIRLLKEVDLFEVSLVAIPANEHAVITAVKADVPFDVLLTRSTAHLTLAVSEAKALWDRRLADGRKPTDAHETAAAAFEQALKDALDGLATRRAEHDAAEAPRSHSTALEMRRRLLVARGVEID